MTAHHKEAIATTPSYGTFLYSKAQPVSVIQSACLESSRLGKFRGIQGENNSCYLDSTLMAMFYSNDTYDGLLAAPKEPAIGATTMDPDVEYARLYLTMHIVNNLRRRGYVPSMLVLEWRRMISPWFGAGVDLNSHCAEEEACEFAGFLMKAFGVGFKSTKFVLLPSETADGHSPAFKEKSLSASRSPPSMPEAQAMLQLLPPPAKNGSHNFIWSTETLVNYTLQLERLRFAELNSSLILQLPRYGKQDRVIGAAAPDPCLHLCYGLAQQQETKASFELCALVVIGTSHFVTYLRVKNPSTQTDDDSYESSSTGVEVTEKTALPVVPQRYSWLYYDSMHDRDDHQNIPAIEDVTAELSILDRPNATALVAQELLASAASPHLKRVVDDMSLAFYGRVG